MTSIKVEGLSKRYRIGLKDEAHTTLAGLLTDWVRQPGRNLKKLRRMTRFSKNGPESPDTIWALKDVSFEVREGEVFGVIGRNGAGKSTLLKILGQITFPTSGRVELAGRVSSLLEVGTGFHPELSGRENVYLNGTILGMSRREIDGKFDEIVDFSGVGKFIDTPIKRYSSGMGVRLAFSVAAHLEPEILLVDEVLAVGDAEFQKKSLGKMGEVARQGRTVLFVSHNMGAITRLCNRSLLLDKGRIVSLSDTAEVTRLYLSFGETGNVAEKKWNRGDAPGDENLRLLSVRICQPRGNPVRQVSIHEPIYVEVETETLKEMPEIAISIQVRSQDDVIVVHTAELSNSEVLRSELGSQLSVCTLPAYILNTGSYRLGVAADIPYRKMVFREENVLRWDVEATSIAMGRYRPSDWRGLSGAGIASWETRPINGSQKD